MRLANSKPNPNGFHTVDLTATNVRLTKVWAHQEHVVLATLAPRHKVEDQVRNVCEFGLSPMVEEAPVTLVPILEGGSYLYHEIMKQLSPFCSAIAVNSLKIQSYQGSQHGGNLICEKGQLKHELIRDQHVVIVEDILDRGRTIQVALNEVYALSPRSVTTVFATRKVGICSDFTPDYCLFDLHPDVFAVGLGMDIENRFRHLPSIYDWRIENYDPSGRRLPKGMKSRHPFTLE